MQPHQTITTMELPEKKSSSGEGVWVVCQLGWKSLEAREGGEERYWEHEIEMMKGLEGYQVYKEGYPCSNQALDIQA